MRHRPDTVMFFCAGRGTRMLALTERQPKPMIRVAGRPLIDHAIDAMEGVERRFANTHYLPDQLEEHLNPIGIETIFEPELLETGGGLKNALPALNRDTVYTMNTDAVWQGEAPAQVLADRWNPDIMDGLMLLIPKAQAIGHKGKGDFVLGENGQLTRGPGDIYGGLQIIKTKFVEQISDTHFSFNLAWETLLQRGTLFGAVYSGKWCDVGHPDAIALAENLLKD